MARLIIIDDEDTRRRELSSSQMGVITHALGVAASRFDEDVKGLVDIITEHDRKSEESPLSPSESGERVMAVRLKEQFERQARDARAVWNLLEGGFDEEGQEGEGEGEGGSRDEDRERLDPTR